MHMATLTGDGHPYAAAIGVGGKNRTWSSEGTPGKYSDHITHDVKGGGINFQPQILIQCSSDEGGGFIDVRAAPEAAGGAPPRQVDQNKGILFCVILPPDG